MSQDDFAFFELKKIPQDKKALRFGKILAKNRVMKELHQQVLLASTTELPVLLEGEMGTGKELVARAIHEGSRRRRAPYVAMNMGAIPPKRMARDLFGDDQESGGIRAAEKGTLFIDEIDLMDLKSQASLLGVLERGEYHRKGAARRVACNLRVLAATNIALEQAVAQGRFHQRLFFRLEVFSMRLAPLRQHLEAVPFLAKEFLRETAESYSLSVDGFSEAAWHCLENHLWPGNIRELKNVIQRAVLLCRKGKIQVSHLPLRLVTLGTAFGQGGKVLTPCDI